MQMQRSTEDYCSAYGRGVLSALASSTLHSARDRRQVP